MHIFPISDIHGLMYNTTDDFLNSLVEKQVGEHPNLTIVIAGDFCDRMLGISMAQRILAMFPEVNIVYVPGNHEYYGSSIEVLSHDLMQASKYIDRLHVLDGVYITSAVVGDVTFIGGTMWTNFNNQNANVMNVAQHGMNDYNYIYTGSQGRTINANRIVNEHYEQRKSIFKHLRKVGGKKVVVTHHKPFVEAITDPLSYAYCVDLDKELNELEANQLPTYWFSGHTHRSEVKTRQYTNGEITFISNQYGYPSEVTTGWSEDCVWEI